MNQEKYNEIYRAVCARVEALGYECAGFEAVSENGMNIVRVYLEMPGGIDTGDCEIVSRDVGEFLDTIEDDLPDHYFLEISFSTLLLILYGFINRIKVIVHHCEKLFFRICHGKFHI